MTRPLPWKCRICGQRKVNPTVVDYAVDMDHDGRSYPVVVPNLAILQCEGCGNQTLPDPAFEKVANALRAQAGLLTPAEIRRKRESLNLTQRQLASYLKVAESTVSRWETGGQIQQRAMDLLVRIFFDVPQARWRFEGSEGPVILPANQVQGHGVANNTTVSINVGTYPHDMLPYPYSSSGVLKSIRNSPPVPVPAGN